jgi:hypothetical protein
VFLHIARFDGFYIAASPSMGTPVIRKKFNELLDELVRDNPVMLPTPSRRPGPDLYIHPSTMLIAAVAALFYKSAPIRTDDHGENPLRQSEIRSASGVGMLSDVYSVALVSAMAIIGSWQQPRRPAELRGQCRADGYDHRCLRRRRRIDRAGTCGGGSEPQYRLCPAEPVRFVIAAAAAPDFKNQEQPVQQVSLSTSDEATPNDQAVVQVASVTTLPTAADFLNPIDPGTSGQAQNEEPSDPVTPTDGGTDVGVPEQPVVETPVPTFYDYVEASGMFVLLSTPHVVETPEPDTPVDVALVGVASDVVDLVA